VETADHGAYLQDDSALNSAICYDHPDILQILLEAGTDPNIHGEHVPALHVAAADDNVEAVVILISHGAKIDVRDTAGNDTALIYGIRDGKFKVAELLLEAGADPNLTDRRGFASLHIAAARNDAKLVRCLLDHGAAIDVRTHSDGRTPLMIAAADGFEEMVEILLSRGADPSIVDSGGKSPFERAVERHRSGVAEILKKASPPLTTSNLEGGQNLNFAMAAERLDTAGPGREPAAESGHSEWLKRAVALEAAKDWEGLLDWCGRWTKSEPKNGVAWYGLGNAYGYIERHSDAMEAYLQAIKIDPEHAKAWNNLGISYRHLDRYDNAIEAYRQVIRIDPKNGDAWYNLGVAYSLSGNRAAALDAVRELRRIDPTGTDELYNLIVRR
jgi:ankyrin repeat protein